MLKAISIIAGIIVVLCAVAAFTFFPKREAPSISGSVWFNRADGQSLIQRGVRVYLLSPKVSAPQIMRVAQAKLEIIRQRADAASEHAGIREDADALKAAIQQVKQPIGVDDAMDLLNGPRFAKYGETTRDEFIPVTIVESAETNVDGVYQIRDVKPGDYVLAVQLAGGTVYREVTVGDQPVKVDLH